MMKEKRKGMLQRGIMVAVSALTVVASAGTAFAYEPMQWSDGSFDETIWSSEPEYAGYTNSDAITDELDFLNVIIFLLMKMGKLLIFF